MFSASASFSAYSGGGLGGDENERGSYDDPTTRISLWRSRFVGGGTGVVTTVELDESGDEGTSGEGDENASGGV